MSSIGQPPTPEILVREPEGFCIWKGFNNGQPVVKLEKVACTAASFSEDGSRIMVSKGTSAISVYDCHTSSEINSFEFTFLSATLSPCGTYLQTFEKSTTPQEKNVKLWHVEVASPAYQFFQKNMSRTTWPSVQFSSDESVACRMVTNEIQFFDGKDFSKGIIYKLRVPGVAAVELSRTPGSHVAAYVAESKGIPASVQIFPCNKDAQQAIARRSFFRCSTVAFHWNQGSTGLLVVAHSDVDKTNQSYYGESKLNYLTIDGSHEGLVPLSKEGPVHDVQWSYSGSEFAVVYGLMPAKATIFDRKCKPLLQLGEGPFNTVRWNPKGRCICLAGFGNLPGDMSFWDYSEKKLLGSAKAEWSVTYEWSPDGRYFMTASTAPRRQVDNGIKIFNYDGSLYYKKMFDKLYQVVWKPESPDKFGDIPELVKSVQNMKIEDNKKKAQDPKLLQAATKTASSTVQKPAAYRPPHAKNADAVKAELFGRIAPAEEMSKNALRNKKRREKQKEKKAAEGSADAGDS